MEKYSQQVELCIVIAIACVDPAMEKRPTAKDIIQVLSAADWVWVLACCVPVWVLAKKERKEKEDENKKKAEKKNKKGKKKT